LITASPPSLLVFSGRRTMQTHSDDECLGLHGVAWSVQQLWLTISTIWRSLSKVEGVVNTLTHPILRQGNTTSDCR
ncbi:unnamed protein product, partial [Brassica rapa]